jgi:outer membrane protein TolC
MRRTDVLLIASLLNLGGPASAQVSLAPERADRPWSPPLRNGIIVSAPPAHDASEGGYVLPPNPFLRELRAPPELDPAHVYNLAELIDLAESNSPETRIAWDEAKNAALATGIARAAFLPNLTASVVGGYQTGHEDSATGLSRRDGRSTLDGSISSVSLKWLLFDFGVRAARVDMARQVSIVSNEGFTAAHQGLIYKVSLAFYADAAARAEAALTDQTLRDAQAVEAAARERYRNGVGTVVETAQAEQATAQAEFAKVRADGSVEDSRQALVNAMGLPPTSRLSVQDVSARDLPTDAAGSISELVTAAISSRPDVLSAYAARETSAAEVRAARAEFLPKVFVSASAAYTSHNLDVPTIPGAGSEGATLNLNGDRFGGTVLFGVSIPIFDGGIRASTLKQARNDADRAAVRLDQVRDQAAREVISAGTTLKTSIASYHASVALLRASQTSFDAALGAYRHGVGSVTDVTVAEGKLLEARNLETSSYSSALAAAAALALSAGQLGRPPAD